MSWCEGIIKVKISSTVPKGVICHVVWRRKISGPKPSGRSGEGGCSHPRPSPRSRTKMVSIPEALLDKLCPCLLTRKQGFAVARPQRQVCSLSPQNSSGVLPGESREQSTSCSTKGCHAPKFRRNAPARRRAGQGPRLRLHEVAPRDSSLAFVATTSF